MADTLVLGLGNEIIADDGAGIFAARALTERLAGKADVVESALCGMALLDLFLGYRHAIIIDAVQTLRCPPGTIHALTPGDLDAVQAPSPHYAGLPEMLALAKQLNLDFPQEINILALEVVDPYTIGGALSEPVKEALPELVRRVEELVGQWEDSGPVDGNELEKLPAGLSM